MEKELKLIEKLHEVEKQISESKFMNIDSQELYVEKVNIEEELRTVAEKPITELKLSNTISVLKQIINLPNVASKKGLVLSRKQPSSNNIYGVISYDIKQAFRSEDKRPPMFNYTGNYSFDKKDNYDHSRLQQILEKEYENLISISDMTYVRLKEFVDNLCEEIRLLRKTDSFCMR